MERERVREFPSTGPVLTLTQFVGVIALIAGLLAAAPTPVDAATTPADSCALLAGGTARCWGDNSAGELGDGTQTERHSPVSVLRLAYATTPAAPIGVAGVGFDSSVLVYWQQPASNGGMPITSYTVTASPGGRTCAVDDVYESAYYEYCAIVGLTNGTSYTFTVKATNAVGAGPVSVASPAAQPVLASQRMGCFDFYGLSTGMKAYTIDASFNSECAYSRAVLTGPNQYRHVLAEGIDIRGGGGPGLSVPCAGEYTLTLDGAATGNNVGHLSLQVIANAVDIDSGSFPPRPKNTLSGRVTSTTGTPIGGIRIEADTTFTGFVIPAGITNTASDGAWSLSLSDDSSYSLNAWDPTGTYYWASYPGNVNLGSSNIGGINFALKKAVRIKGKVTNASGAGIAGVSVFAAPLCQNNVCQGQTNLMTTGSDGSYAVPVVAGTYTLDLRPASDTYSGGYYLAGGITADQTKAAQIPISTADVTVNVKLPRPPRITGKVTSGGKGIAGATVGATINGLSVGTAQTASDGTYSVPAAAGSIYLRVTADGYQGGYYSPTGAVDQPSAVPITVASSDVANINVNLLRLPCVKGTVTDTTGAPIAGVNVVLTSGSGWNSTYGYATTAADGSYSASIVAAGPYVVAFSDPIYIGGYYSASGFTATKASATAVGVGAAGTADVPGVDVRMPRNIQISGKVTGTSGAAAPGITVTAISSGWTSSATTLSDGGYSVLAPTGSYKLGFSDPSGHYATGYYRSGVSGNYTTSSGLASAIPMTTTDSSGVNVQLALGNLPTEVTATPLDTAVRVSWKAPTVFSGPAITGYRVTSSPGGKTCQVSSALACTVTGLTNGQTYTFTVTVLTSSGSGPTSEPSNPATPATIPGAPSGVAATAGSLSAYVTWGAAATHGAAITTYRVTSTPAGDGCIWTAGPLGCTATGLTAGQTYTFKVTATNAMGPGPASAASNSVTPKPPATFHAISPVRVLDTRSHNGLAGKLVANTPATFHVTGRTDVTPVVPAAAVAVTGNVTIVGPTSGWAVYLGPTPVASPSTSTINFGAGQVAGNGLTVALGAGGTLSATFMSTAGATTDLVFDVTGYFTADTSGATYHPIDPVRELDSRSGNGLAGQLIANTPRTFGVAGRNGVPSNAVAVTGNVTAVGSSAGWAVYLGPAPVVAPTTSTVNFAAGAVAGNNLTVALGAGGNLSATYMGPSGATTDLVFDVTGYYTADSTGASYVPISAIRLLDTRSGIGLSGLLGPNSPRTFVVGGHGVPSASVGVTGNVTVVNESAGWALFLGPNPVASPKTSTINFVLGDVKGNGLTVALSGTATLSATYISSAGNSTNLVFDVTGFFVQ